MAETETKDIIVPVHHEDLAEDVEVAKPQFRANAQLDEAAQILHEAGGQTEFSAADKKRVLRMIDLWVCVPMCLVYFLQLCDKSSVSYAAVFDLQTSNHLVGQEYAWLSSCVYVTQLAFQPLSSYALIVFPVKYWVMFNFTAWSIVTVATAACTNFTGLLVCRILLGIFEATILPAFIFMTQMWWTRREQSFRTMCFLIASSSAGIFAPLMAYGIGHVSRGLKPYQGIFIFIGGVSCAFVPIVWFLMPNSPTTAKFLRRGNDRLIALERLRENNTGTKSSKFKWAQVWETFRDPKTYLWSFMSLTAAIPSGGFGAFGSLVTKGFGFDSFTSLLMQMPTGAISIILLLVGFHVTNRIKMRAPVIAVICLFPVAGAAGLVKAPRNQPGALLACYYVAYFFQALFPLIISWANLNAAGSTKRVITTATMFTFQCAGNIIGPQVYLTREAPFYWTGLYTDLACWSALFCTVVFTYYYLLYLNGKKEKQRASFDLPSKLEDMSIMTLEEAAKYKADLTEKLRSQGFDQAKLYENAFDDLTDFENPTFIYVV